MLAGRRLQIAADTRQAENKMSADECVRKTGSNIYRCAGTDGLPVSIALCITLQPLHPLRHCIFSFYHPAYYEISPAYQYNTHGSILNNSRTQFNFATVFP